MRYFSWVVKLIFCKPFIEQRSSANSVQEVAALTSCGWSCATVSPRFHVPSVESRSQPHFMNWHDNLYKVIADPGVLDCIPGVKQ